MIIVSYLVEKGISKNIDTKKSYKRNNRNSKSKRQGYNMKLGDTKDRTA